MKMLEAFKQAGYEVDCVMGDGATRSAQIKSIKQRIASGTRYLFCYSESSTLPTPIASGKKDFTRYPFIDFNLFRLLAAAKVPVGVFLRDIYWKDPNYKEVNPKILRRLMFSIFYHLDLLAYGKWVSALFLPSLLMRAFLPSSVRNMKCRALPPGADSIQDSRLEVMSKRKAILYVGGVGNHYRMQKSFYAAIECPEWGFSFCFRKNDWEKASNEYPRLLKGNMSVMHAEGAELENLYSEHKLASLFIEPAPYRDFAMPFKLFEYLAHGLPIIATENTAAGKFVEQEGIGWTIPYEVGDFIALLKKLDEQPMEIERKAERAREVASQNTWLVRARYVAELLSGGSE